MPTNTNSVNAPVNTVAETCRRLRERASQAQFRIEENNGNMKQRAEQELIMKNCDIAIRRLDKGLSIYTALLDAISSYVDEKRRDGSAAVMAAMRAATHIVPACDNTIIPKCEDGEAWFETQDGIDVSRLEGSGFRSILSVMMRAVVLRSNPQFLQIMILDELFSKLSVENSATLSSYLPVLAQDMQILSIEQKPEVFANNQHTAYKFFLDGDHTVVQREEVGYD